MKQLALLAVLLFTPFTFNANPREDLIYAITESDYESFMKIYSGNNFSQESLRNFNDLANRMIMVRGEWMSKHAFYPQIGKDLLYAALWGATGYFGLGCLGLTGKALEEQKNVFVAIFGAILGTSITTYSGYCCFKRFIAAYQKPKVLLTDAIRIKDALAMHE